jgi:hypothetical protein
MKTKILSVLAFALAFPAVLSAQAGTTFIKVPEGYCWQDTKEYVKTNGRNISADDSQHLLSAQFAELRSGGGDISVKIRTLSEKNKKGEEGCTIVVEELGGAAASDLNQRVNAAMEGYNVRLAARIAAYVTSRENAREKNEKKS